MAVSRCLPLPLFGRSHRQSKSCDEPLADPTETTPPTFLALPPRQEVSAKERRMSGGSSAATTPRGRGSNGYRVGSLTGIPGLVDQYALGKRLGEGSYSIVHEAIPRDGAPSRIVKIAHVKIDRTPHAAHRSSPHGYTHTHPHRNTGLANRHSLYPDVDNQRRAAEHSLNSSPDRLGFTRQMQGGRPRAESNQLDAMLSTTDHSPPRRSRSSLVDERELDTISVGGGGAMECPASAGGSYFVYRKGWRWLPERRCKMERQAIQKEEVTRKELLSEVSTVQEGAGPFVVQLYEVVEHGPAVYLVMEKLDGGELWDRADELKRTPEDLKAKIFTQMLLAVRSLHERKIAHRDIKPQNFMLTQSDLSKAAIILTDFGFATKVVGGNDSLAEGLGSIPFVAPEVIFGAYGLPADVWSLGICLFWMIFGHLPFEGESEEDMMRSLLSCPLPNMTKRKDVPKLAVDLIYKLLHRDPRKRMTAQQALHHPWVVDHLNSLPQDATYRRNTIPDGPSFDPVVLPELTPHASVSVGVYRSALQQPSASSLATLATAVPTSPLYSPHLSPASPSPRKPLHAHTMAPYVVGGGSGKGGPVPNNVSLPPPRLPLGKEHRCSSQDTVMASPMSSSSSASPSHLHGSIDGNSEDTNLISPGRSPVARGPNRRSA